MDYQDVLRLVRELNETRKGGIYQHYKRETYYSITGFSCFKSSVNKSIDEKVVVNYVDISGNPHTRLYTDFFGEVEHEGKIVPRFAKQPDNIW